MTRMPFISSSQTNMPPFHLHEQKTKDEFRSIVDCEIEGYATPFNGFWEVLKGDSVEELVQRTAHWHEQERGSRWIYVTNEETGSFVGVMNWVFHEEETYAKGAQKLVANWWEEGRFYQNDMKNSGSM